MRALLSYSSFGFSAQVGSWDIDLSSLEFSSFTCELFDFVPINRIDGRDSISRWKSLVSVHEFRMMHSQMLVKGTVTEVLSRAETFIAHWGEIYFLVSVFVAPRKVVLPRSACPNLFFQLRLTTLLLLLFRTQLYHFVRIESKSWNILQFNFGSFKLSISLRFINLTYTLNVCLQLDFRG